MNFIRRHLAGLALICGVVTLSIVVYTLSSRAEQNRLAIEKGCILLNNAVIRSSQAAADPKGASAALIAGVLKVIPDRFVRQYATRSRGVRTVVPLVDCERVAEHPEEIRAVALEP